MARAKTRATEDDGEDDMNSATARAARELQSRARAKDAEVVDEDSHEIDVDEPDEDDDDEPSRVTPSREEKKSNRWNEQRQKREEAEERARAADERARAAELRAEALALIHRPQQEQQPSPVDQELDRAFQDRDHLWDEFNGLSAEQQTAKLPELKKRARELDTTIGKLTARREMAGMPQPKTPGEMFTETNYPDIVEHPRGRATTNARIQLLIAQGHQPGLQTLKMALDETRRELRTGPTHGPRDPSLRAKLTNSRGRSSHNDGETRRVVDMGGIANKHKRQMARQMYPDMSEADAMKTWAKKIGSKALEK